MSGVVHGGRLSLPLRARGDEKAAVVLACSEESNLKAFLLAAGHGTRLRPLTDKIPKCLLPIRGIPMLQIWLEACSYFGIEEVLINIHAHAEAVHEFLRKHPHSSKVRVVEEKELLGSAGTLLKNREWVGSEDFFWVFYADVLNQVDFSAMLRVHQARRPAATLGASCVPDPSRCGILDILEDGTVVDFVEKPVYPRGNFAFSGLLLGTQSLLDAIPLKQPADLGFDVLPRLVGKMVAYPISTYLLDIGTMENYEMAQSTWPASYPSLGKLND
jgi:mannose-1-phosphate guanylyltransferase